MIVDLTLDQKRKLDLILSAVILDNYLISRRSNVPMPQMGLDAQELQKLLDGSISMKEAA